MKGDAMKVACSWSGGKDSTLALFRGKKEYSISHLLTITSPEGSSHSHGIPPQVLTKQGEELGITWIGAAAEWETYEGVFEKNLRDFKEKGCEAMIFGDIHIEGHREWTEMICKRVGLVALLPLWQEDQYSLVKEFINTGFKAIIVSLNTDYLPLEVLGEELDQDLLEEFVKKGITPAGEQGEYHTLVIGGPIFQKGIAIHKKGHQVDREKGYAFLTYSLQEE